MTNHNETIPIIELDAIKTHGSEATLTLQASHPKIRSVLKVVAQNRLEGVCFWALINYAKPV